MDPSNITPLAPLASVTAPAVSLPVGEVDFNHDIEVYNHSYHSTDDDDPIGPGKVLTVLRNNSHPVVVTFQEGSEEVVESFSTDGDSASGDYMVKNAVVVSYPFTAYGVLVRDGRNLSFHDELFMTEEAANDYADGGDVVFPVAVTAPDEKPVIVDAIEPAAAEENGDDLTVHDLGPGEIRSAWHPGTGRNLTKGDQVRCFRIGFGYRNCEIKSVRSHGTRSFFIQCEDGSKPYWAKNVNISNRIDPLPEAAPPAPAPQLDEALNSEPIEDQAIEQDEEGDDEHYHG